jgi:hypothetical protein
MSKENKSSNPELMKKLQQARALLDECIADLAGKPFRQPKEKAEPARSGKPYALRNLDYDANERAFMKAHANGLSGGERFGLLLAYLAKGDVKKEIKLKDIETAWSRMTARLGDFNRKYSNDAKEQGLVNTKKHGIYVLQPRWRDIISAQ